MKGNLNNTVKEIRIMASKKTKKTTLSMKITLILFALIPMIFSAAIISVVLINTSSNEVKTTTHNSLVALISETGAAFDYSTERNENVMTNFMKAPIVKQFLQDPENPELAAAAQAYTTETFNNLEGWEGIYIADWNSKVLTHPAPPVVGKVMREGEKLKELQDAMLASDGVYNVGIITSPASGELIISMYAPIFDENKQPIGYIGGGTFVNVTAAKFSDVSALNLKTAYIYFVDAQGTMLYHPDESKIGNPVENAAVKGIIAQLDAGKHPAPECVEYEYKGAMKYAAYYVAKDDSYVAVLTADEDDVLSNIKNITTMTIVLSLISVIVFAVISIIVARNVANPLTAIAKATETLSTGDVTSECNAKSIISEIDSIVEAYQSLKGALNDSMSNVKDSAFVLNNAIVSVDGMTANNVESVSQISCAIDEVASTSQTVAESAQTMAHKATELGEDVETLNENVSSLYESSLTIKNANNDATECMRSVYKGANESVEAMQNIIDKISETNLAIEKIGKAVQAIETIASQTNLLSLNASIEAARAGEAGAGFAVVADEIRSLADSSAESAKDIKQIINNVIELSNGTVSISNRVFDVISKEQADIEQAQTKFNVLSESVESSIAEIDTIKQMSTRLDEIKVELVNVTTDLGALSEELGASAEQVAASCQTVSSACTDTQASTEEMRAINEHMSSAIEFFRLQ